METLTKTPFDLNQPYIDSHLEEYLLPSKGVPTKDPQAALDFCRWLSQALEKAQPLPVSHNGVQVGADPSRTGTPVLSIVIPVFNEEDNLPQLYSRLVKALEEIGLDYEILFIDDGSRDESLRLLHYIASRDEDVAVIELARNFGHQVAISAGIETARGQGVIIIDADLQDPPEVLPQFIEKWREGHDVVYAIRQNRKEGWLKRSSYALFYRLLQRIANITIPLDAGDFCIMDRKVVDILVGMPERNRFVRGIRSWVGLDQVGVSYERDARYAGSPKFTFSRLMYLAMDGLISFSYIPLRMITLLGFGVSVVSILLAIGYTIQKLTRGLSPPGFATTVVAIFFLAGIQLVTIGVIGEYVGRIFEEVKRRPLYVIRKVTRSGQA